MREIAIERFVAANPREVTTRLTDGRT